MKNIRKGQRATAPRVEVAVNGYSWAGSGQVPFLLAERARSEGARSMRAVKGSLAAPLKGGRESWKAFDHCAQWKINQPPPLKGVRASLEWKRGSLVVLLLAERARARLSGWLVFLVYPVLLDECQVRSTRLTR